MPDLSTTYMGLQLSGPIMAGCSGFTANVKDIKTLAESGASAVVLKSIFEEEIILKMDREINQMHSTKDLYPETLEYYENFDNEDALTDYLNLIANSKKAVDIPVIASINCITPYNWPYFARSLQDVGADALELNIFILPADPTKSSADNEQVYFNIIKEVLKEVTIPVSIKISHYFSAMSSSIIELGRSGIQGIVMFNRFYTPDYDIENMETVSTHILSDPNDYLMPLRWIAITSGQTQCDLVATTGIHDGKTALKMILAGAKGVQIATSLYKNGPEHITVMNDEIEKWMSRKGFDTIEAFRGKLSLASTTNPAGLLRAQFMEHFSHKGPSQFN